MKLINKLIFVIGLSMLVGVIFGLVKKDVKYFLTIEKDSFEKNEISEGTYDNYKIYLGRGYYYSNEDKNSDNCNIANRIYFTLAKERSFNISSSIISFLFSLSILLILISILSRKKIDYGSF